MSPFLSRTAAACCGTLVVALMCSGVLAQTSWQPLGGPYAGMVSQVYLLRSQPESAYIFHRDGGVGGLYRSDDLHTWTYSAPIALLDARFAVAPSDEKVIYLPGYRSVDGGVEWKPIAQPVQNSMRSMLVDPLDPDHVFAFGVNGYYPAESYDGGQSWLTLLLTSRDTTQRRASEIETITLQPDGRLIATRENSDHTDQVFIRGLDGVWVSKVALEEYHDINAIYSIGSDYLVLTRGDLYRVNGTSGKYGRDPMLEDVSDIALSGGYVYAATDRGLLRWLAFETSPEPKRISYDMDGLLAVDVAEGRVAIGSRSAALSIGRADGAAWRNTGPHAITFVTPFVRAGGRLFTNSYGLLYQSSDDGRTWTSYNVRGSPWSTPNYQFERDAAHLDRFHLLDGSSALGCQVKASDDFGLTWDTLAVAPFCGQLRVVGEHYYVTGEYQETLTRSLDGGASWRSFEYLERFSERTNLHVSNQGTVYRYNAEGYAYSTDAGETFAPMNTGLEQAALDRWLLPAFQPGVDNDQLRVVLRAFHNGQYEQTLFEKPAGSFEWRPVTSFPDVTAPRPEGLIVEHGDSPGLLASSWRAPSGLSYFLFSRDSGASWELAMKEGTPAVVYGYDFVNGVPGRFIVGLYEGLYSVDFGDLPTHTSATHRTGLASLLGTPHPNPTSHVSHVMLSVPDGGPVRVAVYDLLGRQVVAADDLIAPPGFQRQLTIDMEGLGAGTYLIRASTDHRSEVRAFTLVR